MPQRIKLPRCRGEYNRHDWRDDGVCRRCGRRRNPAADGKMGNAPFFRPPDIFAAARFVAERDMTDGAING